MGDTPLVLLVHGAWHGPWCWERVEKALGRRGVASRTVALPSCGRDAHSLAGLREDAAMVAAAAAEVDRDVVVCGHSYAGMVISDAAFGPNVRRLVYVAAFMPGEGTSLVSQFPSLPPFVRDNGDGSIAFVAEMAGSVLYNDCTPADVAWATSRLVLHSVAAIATPTERAAWKAIPSTYVVCTRDNVIPPDVQRALARQATDSAEIDTSHSPMISQPDGLSDILAGRVRAEA